MNKVLEPVMNDIAILVSIIMFMPVIEEVQLSVMQENGYKFAVDGLPDRGGSRGGQGGHAPPCKKNCPIFFMNSYMYFQIFNYMSLVLSTAHHHLCKQQSKCEVYIQVIDYFHVV